MQNQMENLLRLAPTHLPLTHLSPQCIKSTQHTAESQNYSVELLPRPRWRTVLMFLVSLEIGECDRIPGLGNYDDDVVFR